jgi:uncharacterized membrane protein YfcA
MRCLRSQASSTSVASPNLRFSFSMTSRTGSLGLAPKMAAALPVRIGRTGADVLQPWAWDALAIALGTIVAAYIGAGWLRTISARTLSAVIGAHLVVLGIVLMVESVLPMASDGMQPANPVIRAVAGIGAGLVIGLISSLLGVAGGEVIIPTLVLAFGVPISMAGTLSLLISLPTILTGLSRYWRHGAYSDRDSVVGIILPMAVGAIAGAPIGGWFAASAPSAVLKLALGGLLVWSAWKVFGHGKAGKH